MPDTDLPQDARAAAEAAYRNWRVGDDGEGRLHAALAAAAPLIRAAERERIRQMAVRSNAVCVGDEGTNCYFADLIREPRERSDEKGPTP